ncbi:MAG: hypothetical protein AAGC67_01070, partial [Myxococcota bacterium]
MIRNGLHQPASNPTAPREAGECVDSRGAAESGIREGRPAPFPREAEVAAHLNRDHGALVEALFAESTGRDGTGARAIGIDAEGLLLEAGNTFNHVAFRDVC